MNSEMLFDTLESLSFRWSDLGDAFRRLAEALTNAEATGTGAIIDRIDGTRTATVGLRQRCSSDGIGGAIGEAERLAERIAVLRSDTSTPVPPPTGAQILLDDVFAELISSETGARTTIATDPVTGFGQLKLDLAGLSPPVATDTIEFVDCQNRLNDIQHFILSKRRELLELKDTSGFTERFDVRGIRGSVDNLSAYPILTSGIQSAPVARSSDGAGGGRLSIQRTVNTAIQEVLGRQLKNSDTRSFMIALNQSFESVAVDGRTEYTWVARSYAGQTELGGGVTGGQASLYLRAKTSQSSAMPLLEGLYSLREDEDEELVEASRSIVKTELNELVSELSMEGGPRVSRVDGLFSLLFEEPFSIGKGKSVTGHLALLKHELGLQAENVNTLDEEVNFTNFIAFHDYVSSIRTGWETFRNQLFGRDLGTRFVLLSRALSVAGESVEEINAAMDSVFVGASERQVASFRDRDGHRVLVGDLLSWVVDFTTEEAPCLVREGGRRGALTLIPTAVRLRGLVERLLQALNSERDLPEGMRQPRVQNPIRELRGHLERIERLATEVRDPSTVA